MLPGRKWVLETHRNYEILIEIYDKDSHKIFPSDVSVRGQEETSGSCVERIAKNTFACSSQNVRVDATFDKEYFDVFWSSPNGTYHTVKTLKRGNTLIDGHLRAVLLDVSLLGCDISQFVDIGVPFSGCCTLMHFQHYVAQEHKVSLYFRVDTNSPSRQPSRTSKMWKFTTPSLCNLRFSSSPGIQPVRKAITTHSRYAHCLVCQISVALL